MGSYLSRLFPFLFALFLIKKKKTFETYFIGVLFVLTDVLIYMSGERTAFFFLNLSTIFIICLIKDHQKFRIVTFIIAVVCIIFLSLNSNLTDRMFKDTAKDMGLMNDTKDRKFTFFSPTHDNLYRTGYNMFKDKIIVGHGPKMFRLKCIDKKYATGDSPCSSHPHHFYIQLLAETELLIFS